MSAMSEMSKFISIHVDTTKKHRYKTAMSPGFRAKSQCLIISFLLSLVQRVYTHEVGKRIFLQKKKLKSQRPITGL